MRTDESRDRISTIKGIVQKQKVIWHASAFTQWGYGRHCKREYHAYDTPVSIENTEYDNRRQRRVPGDFF